MANLSFRGYNFSGVSYALPEQVMRVLRSHDVVRGYVALHDNDLQSDGTIKKPHTHFVICCKNAHTVTAVRKWFGGLCVDDVEQNTLAQVCESVTGACRYLLHLDSPDKVLYNISHVSFLNEVSERTFGDFCRGDCGEERQYSVIMAYAMHDISLTDAMRLAPELFIHKYSSMQRLVSDLRYSLSKGDCSDED